MANSVNGNLVPQHDLMSEPVHNKTYADVLRKSKPVIQEVQPSEESSDNQDMNLNSEMPPVAAGHEESTFGIESTVATSPKESIVLNSQDDLDLTMGSEDLESNESMLSEIPECLSSFSDEQVVSEIMLENAEDKADLSCSEATEDQLMSDAGDISNETTKGSSYSEDVDKDIENLPSVSSDESCSCEEDEEEESDLMDVVDMYPTAMKWQLRESSSLELPETVTVLDALGGGKVFLVGTAHFSLESQEDVAKTIRATQPDVVMVELCKSRVNILSLDEATILEESRNMNLSKIRAAIEQNGFMQGVLYLLLLNMSAHITKQLGMAPGGEFRRAFTEAKKVPGCVVHLGDRSIHITLQRALSTLSLWQKLKIGWRMLMNKEPISKQEVEKCKQRDLLEETLAEMTGEFPELSQVFVQERDTYLAYSLQMAAMPLPSHIAPNGITSTVVVGVVGIGHVPGIVEKWGNITEKDIPPILSIPEPSTSSKVVRKVIRYSLYGLVLYGCYRMLPKSVFRKPVSVIGLWFTRS